MTFEVGVIKVSPILVTPDLAARAALSLAAMVDLRPGVAAKGLTLVGKSSNELDFSVSAKQDAKAFAIALDRPAGESFALEIGTFSTTDLEPNWEFVALVEE